MKKNPINPSGGTGIGDSNPLFSSTDNAPDYYRHAFKCAPHACFLINRNFLIIDANREFERLYPFNEMGKGTPCYRIIPAGGRETPCPECLVRAAFLEGTEQSAEEVLEINGRTEHYYKQVTPIRSKEGEITAAMVIIKDISKRVTADEELSKRIDKLEKELARRYDEQREREKNLTVLVHTVYEIKGAHNIQESMDKITTGFRELGARSIAFALFNNRHMRLARLYPPDLANRINGIFSNISIMEASLLPETHAGNPLLRTSLVGKPVFYPGETDLFAFFKECFSDRYDHEIAEAAYLFRGQSLVVFPLKTRDSSVGSIAIAVDSETLERNIEYLNFLANSAAMEISRQNSSESLMRSEMKYRNMVECSRDMIILCTYDGVIRYSNPWFHRLTGISPDTREELNIFNFFNKDNGNRIREAISAGLEKSTFPEPLKLEMKAPGRRRIWTEMIINPVAEEFRGFQIVGRDVTRSKTLENLVGNLSAFQEKILQNDAIGIITTNLKGTVTSWNQGAINILGYAPPEVLNRDINRLFVMDAKTGMDAPSSGETAGLQGRELKIRKKDGGIVDVMYVESAMKDEAGRPIAIIAFFFDNTEKVRLEEKWRELSFRLQQAQLITIVSLAKLAEYRDIETGQHLERIMKYTETIARELATLPEYSDYITEEYILDLVNSCPLHDIGKVGIPDSILHKPARLTPDEFEIIKKHSEIGGDTIAEAEKKVQGRSYLNLGKEIAYYHHERWDGTGYPHGLKGNLIPLSARIVAVSDVYDALISKRPYKEPYDHTTARDIIVKGANSHFDQTVVQAFLNREKDIIALSGNSVH